MIIRTWLEHFFIQYVNDMPGIEFYQKKLKFIFISFFDKHVIFIKIKIHLSITFAQEIFRRVLVFVWSCATQNQGLNFESLPKNSRFEAGYRYCCCYSFSRENEHSFNMSFLSLSKTLNVMQK